ncbi:hypothetical protein [Salinisphaera sp. PC39]|uniref:hypothetical protein n=1 Tax=Salinisphaera sp. PC39 TaxID=1304156 RepID=UPI003340E662
MENVFAWVIDNKEWLFSGVGLAVVAWVGRLIFKKTSASSTQTIRSGDGSTNVQAGRDVNIGTKKKGNDAEK